MEPNLPPTASSYAKNCADHSQRPAARRSESPPKMVKKYQYSIITSCRNPRENFAKIRSFSIYVHGDHIFTENVQKRTESRKKYAVFPIFMRKGAFLEYFIRKIGFSSPRRPPGERGNACKAGEAPTIDRGEAPARGRNAPNRAQGKSREGAGAGAGSLCVKARGGMVIFGSCPINERSCGIMRHRAASCGIAPQSQSGQGVRGARQASCARSFKMFHVKHPKFMFSAVRARQKAAKNKKSPLWPVVLGAKKEEKAQKKRISGWRRAKGGWRRAKGE